jgi:hypothetical protein
VTADDFVFSFAQLLKLRHQPRTCSTIDVDSTIDVSETATAAADGRADAARAQTQPDRVRPLRFRFRFLFLRSSCVCVCVFRCCIRCVPNDANRGFLRLVCFGTVSAASAIDLTTPRCAHTIRATKIRIFILDVDSIFNSRSEPKVVHQQVICFEAHRRQKSVVYLFDNFVFVRPRSTRREVRNSA